MARPRPTALRCDCHTADRGWSRVPKPGCLAPRPPLLTALPWPLEEEKGVTWGLEERVRAVGRGEQFLGVVETRISLTWVLVTLSPMRFHPQKTPCDPHLSGLTSDLISHGQQVGERGFETPLTRILPLPPLSPHCLTSHAPQAGGSRRESVGVALPSARRRGAAAPSCLRAGDASPAQLIMWKIGRNCMSLSGK